MHEGVATIENGEGRKRQKPMIHRHNALCEGLMHRLYCVFEALTACAQAFGGKPQLLAWIVAKDSSGQLRGAAHQALQRVLDGTLQPKCKFIDPLLGPMQGCRHASAHPVYKDPIEPAAHLQYLKADCPVEPNRLVRHAVGNLVLRLCNQFCRRGWSRSAQVRDKVRDGEIGFVSNRRNYRQIRRNDGARNSLAIERSHILKRSTAAGQHNYVHHSRPVQCFKGDRYLAGRGLTLHRDRKEHDIQTGMTPGDNVEKIANDCARRRGDNGYSSRKLGQWTLSIYIEKAFSLELLLQLLKGELQRAGTNRLDCLGYELQLSTVLIDAHPSAHQHVQAIFGFKTEQHGLAPEKHHGKLGIRVLDREVDVA